MDVRWRDTMIVGCSCDLPLTPALSPLAAGLSHMEADEHHKLLLPLGRATVFAVKRFAMVLRLE
ncbi:hypothetical protein Rhsp01_47310 [Rhizobium sp. NBRC 114257]|nr:hypothetical protein Rhsp01_47310 [Rhizobium sp. NBRC 114257]